MKIITIVFSLCILSMAVGEEFIYNSSTRIVPKQTPISTENEVLEAPALVQPVWKGLEKLNQEQRENSRIELILESDANSTAQQLARRIENLWNSGKFEDALALFPSLGTLTNIDKMAIGQSWLNPVMTENPERWGDDVRIGTRDSIMVTAFDIHRATGNLFAAFLLQGDGSVNRWCVYQSTDDGVTWGETYTWWASYEINSLSAAVVQNHFYVGFSRGGSQDQAFLYRFRTDNGQQHNFSTGSAFLTIFTTTSPNFIKEVSLSSNQDYFNNRLYYSAITDDGTLRFFWGLDTAFVTYNEITTNVTDADRGLDIASDENYSTRYQWISYYKTDNSLQIDAINASSGSWEQMDTYPTGTGTDISSISAYGDTITCFFDYHGNVVHTRYLVTYDGGTSWFYGWVDDTSTTSESPSVTARAGGGVGSVYRFYTNPREGRYAYRYYRGNWNSPVVYTDTAPYWNMPSIEYLGNNNFGVVYLSWTTPVVRGAYFDRSDWVTGIVNEPEINSAPDRFVLYQNYPNPFNPNTTIQFYIPQKSQVTLDIYDNLGRHIRKLIDGVSYTTGSHSIEWDGKTELRDLAPSGVYYYKLKTADFQQTRKMLLIK